MKFYYSQVNSLLELISSGKIKAVLLYGPDKGYIDKICSKISNKFELRLNYIEYQELNASSLELLLNSYNFFSQKELIKIRSVPSTVNKDVKAVLAKDFFHLPVFIADELTSSASIKKFFELEKNLASIGCYYDDEQKIERIILSTINKANKKIQKDALTYLKIHLQGDHRLICNEIEKLMYFTSEQEEITLKDIKSVLSHDMIASGDELCIYFAKKEYNNFLKELALLKEQNINEVLIIRALIRYYINLYFSVLKVQNGINLDLAIKSLSTPIFYKYVDDFKAIMNNITLPEIIHMLSRLQKAEVDYKLAPAGFDLYNFLIIPLTQESHYA